MGGNIGLPILAQEPLPEGGVYVLELSSYQIDLTFSLDCDVAVLLNVTPDHLDRYDGFEAYAASKARLFDAVADHARSRAATSAIADASATDPVAPAMRPVALAGAAGAAQCAERARRDRGLRGARAFAAMRSRRGLAPIPACRTGWSGWRSRTACCSSTTARRPTRTSTAPALAAYPACPLDCRRARQDATISARASAQLGHVRAAYTIGEAGPMFARLLEGEGAGDANANCW